MASDLHCFPDAQIKSKFPLALPLHVVYGFKIFHVDRVSAVFMVLGDPGMMPLLFFDSFFVFIPSEVVGSGGLANVRGFFRAGASVAIDAFLFMWMRSGFIAIAEDVFEFGPCCEDCVYAGLAEYALELGCDFFDVGEAGI